MIIYNTINDNDNICNHDNYAHDYYYHDYYYYHDHNNDD